MTFINSNQFSTEKSRRRSLKDFLFRGRSTSNVTKTSDSSQLKPVLECMEDGKSYRFLNQRPSVNGSDESESKDQEDESRFVAAVVILEEFSRELSAIAQEHFVHFYVY